MNPFAFILEVFRLVFGVASTASDAVDVAKAKTTAWKAEAMKEVADELDGVKLEEVAEFYEGLYHRPTKKRK